MRTNATFRTLAASAALILGTSGAAFADEATAGEKSETPDVEASPPAEIADEAAEEAEPSEADEAKDSETGEE